MKNILNERNTWHPFALRKCVKIVTIILSLLLLPTSINSETVTTGNILTNSTFGTGTTYSTNGWTVSEGTHGHNYMSSGGGNDIGGSVAAEEDTIISQTVSLADDTNMITEEIQSGWSSTLSSDIWFWNNYDNTTILKQTITGSDGSTSTNQRVIVDTGCGSINCGQFTNYTDTYIQAPNTQTDFDIGVSVSNTNTRSGHWGPDIDDVELSVSYTKYEPITEEIQEIFDDINEIDFEYEDVYFDEPIIEDDFFWEEFEEVFFEEEFFEEEFETVFLEEFERFEEFEEAAFEELEVPEEFEEFFNDFSDEEMEILEEEFADEFTDEIMDEVMEEEPTDLAKNKTETEEEIIEEETNEEKEVATKEETTEDTTEEIKEKNETIDTPEKETKTTKVLTEEKEIDVVEKQDNKLDIKVNDNVTIDVKEITLFDNGNELATYQETNFYQPENIYTEVDNSLFIQADLSIYNQGIYINIGLDNYISTDPIGQHKQKLYDIRVNKLELMIELEKLKGLL